MIDLDTDFGARAAGHLRDDVVMWLTTVGAAGNPVPTPVWFLWDGDRSVRVYSLASAVRLKHVVAQPNVALHFDGDGQGGDIVIFAGQAAIVPDAPPADAVPGYLAKYDDGLARLGLTGPQFAESYSVALDIELTRLRGH